LEFLLTYWYYETTEYDHDMIWNYPHIMYYFGQQTPHQFIAVDGGIIERNIYRNMSVPDNGMVLYGGGRIYSYPNGVNSWWYIEFQNNLVDGSGFQNDNDGGQIVGVRGPYTDVIHNSINMPLTHTNSPTVTGISIGSAGWYMYNNAISMAVSQPNLTKVSAFTGAGDYLNNGVYTTGRVHASYATANAAYAAGINVGGIIGPVNFNPDLTITTGPSSAEDVGLAGQLPDDFSGAARDGVAPDAGAYEFSTGVPLGLDVFPTTINPPGAGIPSGVPQFPGATIVNNSLSSTGSFNVTLTEPLMSYTSTKSVTLGPRESQSALPVAA
jgi:hypothetical protein